MSENKTKIINIDKKTKDRLLMQAMRSKKPASKPIDTGKAFDISQNTDKDTEEKPKKRLLKKLYILINEEELSDSVSERMVRIFGIISGLLVILAIIICFTLYYFLYASYSANYKMAQNAESSGNYDSALRYYEKALDKTDDKNKQITVLNDLIRLSEDQETDLNVKSYLYDLISIEPDNEEAVLKLKNLYLDSNDIDAVFNLADLVSDSDSVNVLYDIILNQPVFNYKSGTYDEPLAISITSDKDCKIYYTTDGSEASETSALYTDLIQLDEPGVYTINAISVNVGGVVSNNYSVNYTIISDILEAPNIYPKSGEFTTKTEILIDIPEGYKAYYTLDGSEPTTESDIFKKGMTIPYGNNIFTVRFISQNGNKSESTSRIYIFEPDYDITFSEAKYILSDNLIDKKIISEAESYLNIFNCTDILTFDEKMFYCITVSGTYNGDGEYAVQVNNGAVFKLKKDESGSYFLTTMK